MEAIDAALATIVCSDQELADEVEKKTLLYRVLVEEGEVCA